MATFECVSCSHVMQDERLDISCERCGSAVLLSSMPPSVGAAEKLESSPVGVWRYRSFLPEVETDDVVSLGEGGTPLLSTGRLGREMGLRNLWIKDESRNPTGSFMDRGSTVLVSLSKRSGINECSCVTTGNLGASLAAYCAKAGITARIRIHPSTDRGKLYQMLAYGAEVEARPRQDNSGSHDSHVLRVTAGNPYLLEGEKTTGLEILQELGWKTPDMIVVPVGTGGHLSMTWRAIKQASQAGLIKGTNCRLLGVSVGSATSVEGQRSLSDPFTELEESEPYFLKEAQSAISESRGFALKSTVDQTVRATGVLAKTEGIFAEPASASVVGCLSTAMKEGLLHRDDVVVCVVTGAGLKDTKAVARLAKAARRLPIREGYSVPSVQVGSTKLDLLRMLAVRPNYGYQIWRSLTAGREITTASVYQHLAELEEGGLVRKGNALSFNGRPRFPYELTARGKNLLRIADNLSPA